MSYYIWFVRWGYSGIPSGKVINISLRGRSRGLGSCSAKEFPNYKKKKLFNDELIIDNIKTRGNERLS